MDFSFQMRSFDMLVKFLKHDLAHMPVFDTGKRNRFSCAGSPSPLPRSTPEAQGVPSGAVLKLIKAISSGKDMNAHSFVILRHSHVIAEGSWAPYRANCPHMLYSVSKSVTGTAAGIAADEGLLDPDESIADIFKDRVTPSQSIVMRKITVRHLLTMSSGIRFNEPGTAFCDDWVKMFFSSVPKFEPGSAFEYNSLNTYMLSAILREKTGMGLVEYLTPRLFEPLGISEADWEVCPKGIEKGGWGLSLTTEDAAKLGQLYLNMGMWNGKQILSRKWVEEATKSHIPTPNGECRYGYGYQIWMHDDEGAYQFNGAFGQHVIVLPKCDVVISIASGATKLFSGSLLAGLIKEFASQLSGIPLKENPAEFNELDSMIKGLVYALDAPVSVSTDKSVLTGIAESLSGSEYLLKSNIGGAFPFILQCVYGNFTSGISGIRFIKTERGFNAELYEQTDCNTLIFTEGIACSEFSVKGERQPVGMRTQWRRDEDGTIVLFAAVSFIKTPNTRIFTFTIKDGRIHVQFDESPGVGSAVAMYCEITGLNQLEYYRKLIPVLAQERLQKKIREIASPTAEGHKAEPASDSPEELRCERPSG